MCRRALSCWSLGPRRRRRQPPTAHITHQSAAIPGAAIVAAPPGEVARPAAIWPRLPWNQEAGRRSTRDTKPSTPDRASRRVDAGLFRRRREQGQLLNVTRIVLDDEGGVQ